MSNDYDPLLDPVDEDYSGEEPYATKKKKRADDAADLDDVDHDDLNTEDDPLFDSLYDSPEFSTEDDY